MSKFYANWTNSTKPPFPQLININLMISLEMILWNSYFQNSVFLFYPLQNNMLWNSFFQNFWFPFWMGTCIASSRRYLDVGGVGCQLQDAASPTSMVRDLLQPRPSRGMSISRSLDADVLWLFWLPASMLMEPSQPACSAYEEARSLL